MKTSLSLTFLLLCLHVSAQRIISDCSDKNNGVAYFTDDVDQILLQRMKRNDPDYFHTKAEINKDSFQYFINKLLAIRNAKFTAHDTIFALLMIHEGVTMPMRNVIIIADSNLYWMVNLKNKATVSGNPEIDEIIKTYGLTYGYSKYFDEEAMIFFKADRNINALGLAYYFGHIHDVRSAFNLNEGVGTSRDIHITKLNDSTDEIILSYGWEDCPSGCVFWINWTFHVYNDCSLEYLGATGDLDKFKMDLAENSIQNKVSLFPNPFLTSFTLDGLTEEVNYRMYDYKGSLLMSGVTRNYVVDGMENIPSGLYILQIQSGALNKTIRISKL